jgi:hypothetical protein
MIAPTWCFLIGSSFRSSFSIAGIRNARVFPLPVTASTTTSLWPRKSGIVEACTGVMRAKPMVAVASRIHCESEGVRASHARVDDGEDAGPLSGAIVVLKTLRRCAWHAQKFLARLRYIGAVGPGRPLEVRSARWPQNQNTSLVQYVASITSNVIHTRRIAEKQAEHIHLNSTSLSRLPSHHLFGCLDMKLPYLPDTCNWPKYHLHPQTLLYPAESLR